jgi:hypothetical protein
MEKRSRIRDASKDGTQACFCGPKVKVPMIPAVARGISGALATVDHIRFSKLICLVFLLLAFFFFFFFFN